MRQSFSILAAGLIAVRAQAPDSLPECGQLCVNNMLQNAVSDFGCDANDLASCACCNVDFGYGIRDCSREACGEGSEDYSSVVSYGSSYCASAVSTCPSGTQATNVIASATGGGGSGTGASGSAATPAMTSGPMGGGASGAAGAVSAVSGQSNAYVVNGQTITAGGDSVDEDDTAYSALPSGAGVLISNGDMQSTYVPGSGAGGSGGSGMSSSMMTMSSSGSGNAGGAGGALGAAASQVMTGDGDNNYVVAGDNTISNGGNQYENDGTTYSALPSGGGVLVVADGSSTTVNPASASASTTGGSGGGAGGASETSSGGGAGGAGGASETSGGSGGNGGDDNSGDGGDSSGQSGNFAPVQTAAPALIGAAAMAIFAL